MAEVRLSNVSKAFDTTQALSDVSLTIPDGAFVVLLGPTGAGKTTTLRLIAGLEKPDAGDIAIGGASVLTDTPVSYTHLDVYKRQALPSGCSKASSTKSRANMKRRR